MGKGRLEAFSDGVMAVIITIMVLELHPPEAPTLTALAGIAHPFFAYVLSFVYVGIYWNNHHHLFQSVNHVNGRVLWTNNFLLFCLSLVPFTTNWMGETGFALVPTVICSCRASRISCWPRRWWRCTAGTRRWRVPWGAGSRNGCRWCSMRWASPAPSSIPMWRSRSTWRWRRCGSFPTGASRRA
jgi:hypothetical protein